MERTKETKLDYEKNITAETVIFFDLDGTLIDSDFANFLSYHKSIQSITESDIDLSFNPDVRLNRGVLKTLIPNLTETEYHRIIDEKEKCFNIFLPKTKLNNTIAEILFKYSDTNKTVLVTNCRKDRAMETIEYHGLKDKFSDFFFRTNSDSGAKINKFQNAILALNVSPKLVIAFENEETEIADAKQAGIEIINPIII